MYFSNTWFLKDLFTKGTISKKPLGLTYSCEKQLIYSIGQELKMKMRIKDQIIKYQTIWNKQEWGGKSRSPISGVPSGELRAKMEGKKREDAVYCTVVTQIVTSHSRVQDDPTKFSFFLPHWPNWTWDDCDSHLVKNTKMLSTDWINIFNKLQDNTFILHKNFSSRNLSLNNFTAAIYTFWNFPY